MSLRGSPMLCPGLTPLRIFGGLRGHERRFALLLYTRSNIPSLEFHKHQSRLQTMRQSHHMLQGVLLVLWLLSACTGSPAQTAAPMSSDISFTVAMPKPHTHLFEIEMRVKIPANLQAPNES